MEVLWCPIVQFQVFAISMLMSLPTSLGNVPQESTWATCLLARLTKESTRFKQNSFASFGPCSWGWSSSSCLQAMATRLGIQNASHFLGPYMPLYIKRKTIHILTAHNHSSILMYTDTSYAFHPCVKYLMWQAPWMSNKLRQSTMTSWSLRDSKESTTPIAGPAPRAHLRGQ